MAEDEIKTVESGDSQGPATHTTTIIRETSSGGGSAGWLILIVLIIAVGAGIYIFSQMSASEAVKDNAIADTANKVGNAAEEVGDAAQKAGEAVEDAAGTLTK